MTWCCRPRELSMGAVELLPNSVTDTPSSAPMSVAPQDSQTPIAPALGSTRAFPPGMRRVGELAEHETRLPVGSWHGIRVTRCAPV